MKLTKIFLVFCIALFCSIGFSWASDDWELWAGNTIKVKINDKISLNFLEEFRINDNMSTFYTYVLYSGVYVKLNKYIDVAGWYKFVESKKANHWEDSHRYDIDAILKYDMAGFKLSNRSRFEHNLTKSSFLHRDRIKVARSFEIFGRKYTPYVSNEFFLDIDPDWGYHENRLSSGISTGFFFNTKLTVYYMARAKKSNDNWTNANIIGFYAGISF